MLPDVTLSGVEVSDLFFNAEHPEWEAVCSYNENEAARKAALTEDARVFVESTPSFDKAGITAEMLVEDFMRRL